MRNLAKYLRKEKAEDPSNVDARGYTIRPKHGQWAAPTRMATLFIVGVVLAVAHHVYYTNLNETTVGSTARQQWPIIYLTECLKFARS